MERRSDIAGRASICPPTQGEIVWRYVPIRRVITCMDVDPGAPEIGGGSAVADEGYATQKVCAMATV